MKVIAEYHNFQWYFTVWLMAFLVCVMILWYKRGEMKRGKDMFIPMIPLAAIVVYNPLTAALLVPRFLPTYLEYARLAWLFFVIPVIAYVTVMLQKSLEGKLRRFLFVAAVLFTLFLFSNPDNRRFFVKAQNPYKISQDALDACALINADSAKAVDAEAGGASDSDARDIDVVVQTRSHDYPRDNMGADGRLFYGLRQYENRYNVFGRVVPKGYYTDPARDLSEQATPDTDYYICPKSRALYKKLKNLHYSKIGETENFAIFRNNAAK